MNRYRNYGPLDDVPDIVGDAAFTRLDMQTDPATLPPGAVQLSENFRFDTRQVRKGITLQFKPGTSIGQLRYADVYRPDGGNDHFALATEQALVLFDPADQSTEVFSYPSGETVGLGEAVDLVQAGVSSGTTPDLYLLRGFTESVLKFNAAAVTVAASFQAGEFALFYQDRIAVNATRQAVKVSDFLDFTVWSLLNQFQIAKGGDDYLVGLLAYQKDLVIIGTRKRFYLAFFDPKTTAAGYAGGLEGTTSFLRELTREAGPVGRRAMKEVNGKIWFITDNAIHAFQPRLDLELTKLEEPISAAIQPIMDRLSANHASGACIEVSGFRIYFAMPISGAPVTVTDIDVEEFATVGIDLPFDLPALLAAGAIGTATTGTAHGLRVGDLVQLSGVVDPLLNGMFTVTSTPDDTHFSFVTDASAGADVGERATAQHVATRNNTIAVYNTHLAAWESIDTPPSGFFIDFMRVADYGARRRLWVIDRDLGPALYEDGESDVIGDVVGGVNLPVDLPVDLNTANFASAPIPGRVKSRRYRFPFARKINAGRAALNLGAGDAGRTTLTVRSPGANTWTRSRPFDGTQSGNRVGRVRCGKRGVEAELEVVTDTGRPVIRTFELDTTATGRTQEE